MILLKDVHVVISELILSVSVSENLFMLTNRIYTVLVRVARLPNLFLFTKINPHRVYLFFARSLNN